MRTVRLPSFDGQVSGPCPKQAHGTECAGASVRGNGRQLTCYETAFLESVYLDTPYPDDETCFRLARRFGQGTTHQNVYNWFHSRRKQDGIKVKDRRGRRDSEEAIGDQFQGWNQELKGGMLAAESLALLRQEPAQFSDEDRALVADGALPIAAAAAAVFVEETSSGSSKSAAPGSTPEPSVAPVRESVANPQALIPASGSVLLPPRTVSTEARNTPPIAIVAPTVAAQRKRKAKRHRFDKDQTEILKNVFARTQKPSPTEREQLAAKFGVEMQKVDTWFQNQRQAFRRRSAVSKRRADTSESALLKKSPQTPSASLPASWNQAAHSRTDSGTELSSDVKIPLDPHVKQSMADEDHSQLLAVFAQTRHPLLQLRCELARMPPKQIHEWFRRQRRCAEAVAGIKPRDVGLSDPEDNVDDVSVGDGQSLPAAVEDQQVFANEVIEDLGNDPAAAFFSFPSAADVGYAAQPQTTSFTVEGCSSAHRLPVVKQIPPPPPSACSLTAIGLPLDAQFVSSSQYLPNYRSETGPRCFPANMALSGRNTASMSSTVSGGISPSAIHLPGSMVDLNSLLDTGARAQTALTAPFLF